MADAKREERPIPDQVRVEHRRLYGLLLQVREAFYRGEDAAGVGEAFAVLRREFEAHFDQEDRFYYVPLAERHPELKPTFDDFAEAHGHLRRMLVGISEQLERGDVEGASPAVLKMALAFEQHESEEEDVLRGLDPLGDHA